MKNVMGVIYTGEKDSFLRELTLLRAIAAMPVAGRYRVIDFLVSSMVGSGMRNERIRTYNFPQGRVTDHRIGLTLYQIDAVMDGDLDEIIDGLVTADQAERMKASQEE